jgi:hypothetical protein
MGANGWVRLAGSLNIKPKNSPNFPTVRVEEVQRCAKASPADFHALELAAPAEPSTGSYRAAQPVNGKRPRAFPSYERCLKGAPSAAAGEKDRSLADFTWCCIAIRWGWFPEEAAAQLIKEPLSKAHVRGEQYAMYTAMKAAAAVAGAPPRA